MKRKAEDLPDITISKISFYGEDLDFFFMAAAMTRSEDLSDPQKPGKKRDLVRLKPEKS